MIYTNYGFTEWFRNMLIGLLKCMIEDLKVVILTKTSKLDEIDIFLVFHQFQYRVDWKFDEYFGDFLK